MTAEPEKPRRSHKKTAFRLRKALGLMLLIPLAVSLADEEVSLNIVNATRHFIHAIAGGEPLLYIGPGTTVTISVKGTRSLIVEAVYSPGQGIAGRAVDTLDAGLGEVTTCTNLHTCRTTPTGPSSVTWTVTAQAMQTL